MPKKITLSPFGPESYYHVFNRTNNRELLFRDDQDRIFFLSLYQRFILPYVKTCAYCLLSNHFHFLIYIRPFDSIIQYINQIPETQRTIPQKQMLSGAQSNQGFHDLIERQFTRFFTSYAMYFNKRYRRSGNLFYRPFKRVHVLRAPQLAW